MEINSAYQTQSLWDLDAVNSVELSTKNTSDVKSSQKGGDTVEISNDARELFSQMIHKADGSNVSVKDSSQDSGNGAGGSAGGGSGTSSSSGTSADSLRSQIQALKSQLAAASSGEDGGSTGQASGLSAQIAALEAQLQSAESAG